MLRPLVRLPSCRVALLAAAALSITAAAPGAAAARPLVTALYVENHETEPWAFERIHAAGARVVRLQIRWADVAPSRPPTRRDARDPAWPGYRWTAVDHAVSLASAAGLDPLVTVFLPPAWAANLPPKRPHGPWNVNVRALADFARAAAERYSGRLAPLPRVRYWLVWNEPNLARYLNPQYRHKSPYAPRIYRGLVNAFADAVHGVHRDNRVVAGATAPFTTRTGRPGQWGLGPLAFMRAMLCIGQKLEPTCRHRSRFDVWAHHPYTTGGPTQQAYHPNDVSLGDLPEMNAVLQAAIRHRRIVSRVRPQFWVTEFSWDTSPPDRKGVPLALHGRWTAEALYQMWRSGVSLAVWLQLRDAPISTSYVQSGLYLRGATPAHDRPKPALQAFRFPFVAYARKRGVFVWGRTPAGRPARVAVEQRAGRSWRRLAVVRTSRYGVFARTVKARKIGWLRARVVVRGGAVSRPFSLRRPPARRYYPFGT